MFLLNSIHDNRARACVNFCVFRVLPLTQSRSRLLLATTPAGAAILDRLMVLVGALFEGETAEGIAHGEFTSDIFQLS